MSDANTERGTRAGESADLVTLVMGVLSTFPPHHLEHPEDCIPMARAVVNALEGRVYDHAFEMAHDDVLTAWRVRNAALAVAAAFVHPGPDHADMTARQALVREWVGDGHDAVEEENHQRTQMLGRMIRAEDALALMVEAFRKHDRWCGHNLDAPGDAIFHEAMDAAEAVLTTRSGRPTDV